LITIGTFITAFAGFWLLLSCRPVEYLWRQVTENESGTCKSAGSTLAAVMLQAAWILGADIALGMVIPIILLSRLNMHHNAKVSVFLLLGIGSL
jgi:hypothetical protein